MYSLEIHTVRGEILVGPFSTEQVARKQAERAAYRGWIWSGTTLLVIDAALKIIVKETT